MHFFTKPKLSVKNFTFLCHGNNLVCLRDSFVLNDNGSFDLGFILISKKVPPESAKGMDMS